ANRKNFFCMAFENEEVEAEKAIMAEKTKYKAMAMISHEQHEGGISIDKLREIAKALQVPNVDGMKDYQVRKAVQMQLEEDEKKTFLTKDPDNKGYAYFLKLANNQFDYTTRKNVQEAIDFGVIVFNADV